MDTGLDGPIEALKEQSRQLAQSDAARQQWFREAAAKSNVVEQAAQIWTAAIESRQTSRHVDGEGNIVEAGVANVVQDEQMERSTLCARILRNAVVGSPDCQDWCYDAVPAILRVLWITTSFAYDNDEQVHVFTRTLVQLLSNLVTMNEKLQDRLWYQTICNDKEDGSRTGADLFGRLLQSSDAATSSAVQVLLLNCTLESSQRCTSLSTSRSGAKLLSSMLETVQRHLNRVEDEDGGKGKPSTPGSRSAASEHDRKQSEGLSVLYAFFTNLFDRQLFGSVFSLLRPVKVAGQESITSLVSQSQLALLRLLDTYLHYGALSFRLPVDGRAPTAGLEEVLVSFQELAKWAEKVMRDALEGGSKGHVDPRLVEVHIALLLMLQCFITLGLKAEAEEGKEEDIEVVAKLMLGKMRSIAFVQLLVSLLHKLAEFAPPISPFRPTQARPTSAPDQPPPGHALTSTGAAAASDASESGPGLDFLKRDIVNLLGILSYKRRSDSKEAVLLVQDTVREGGGLFDVLNMTQLDEHNPYIRERAIFTLRNLLLDNIESQDVVAKLKPVPR